MIEVQQTTQGTVLSGYNVRLRPVMENDLEQLRQWRNDDSVRLQMHDITLISEQQQRRWYAKTSSSEYQYHWLIEYKSQPIGTTNVKSLSQEPVKDSPILEAGLYIGDKKYQGNIVAFAPTLVMYEFCFNYMKTKKLMANVKPQNKAAIKYNQALGYRIIGQGELVQLLITKNDFELETEKLRRFLSR